MEQKHYHDFHDVGGGRMGIDTPGGYIEISNYPHGDAFCSCGESAAKPWAVRAVEAGKGAGVRTTTEAWLWFVVGYFEGVTA